MSILIKGMEMPNDGKEWIMFLRVAKGEVELFDPIGEDESVFYKAVELPPHGRLIDGEMLLDDFRQTITECKKWKTEAKDSYVQVKAEHSEQAFIEAVLRVKAAPTIVPAEGKED